MDYNVTRYEILSQKINRSITCALITDLHNKCYDADNHTLLSCIRKERPDFILCAGDLIVGLPQQSYQIALSLLKGLGLIAPVYYANGNHETEYRLYAKSKYMSFIRKASHAGVHVMNNRSEDLTVNDDFLRITGLEIPLKKYKKFRKPSLDLAYIEKNIGPCILDTDPYTILIAHNPEFFDTYRQWGADLTVSGHYHGGVVREPFTKKALLSPYGYPFPKFGVGKKELTTNRYIIASAGLGDHAIPLRIFNPRELVIIKIVPARDRLI